MVLKCWDRAAQVSVRSTASTGVPSDQLASSLNVYLTFRGSSEGQVHVQRRGELDRKSTRLNSSHVSISYAVFCLKKKIYNTIHKLIETRHLEVDNIMSAMI